MALILVYVYSIIFDICLANIYKLIAHHKIYFCFIQNVTSLQNHVSNDISLIYWMFGVILLLFHIKNKKGLNVIIHVICHKYTYILVERYEKVKTVDILTFVTMIKMFNYIRRKTNYFIHFSNETTLIYLFCIFINTSALYHILFSTRFVQ